MSQPTKNPAPGPRYFQGWWSINSPYARDLIIEEYPAESVPLWLASSDLDVPTLGTREELPLPTVCVLVSLEPRPDEKEEVFMSRVYNKVRNSFRAFDYDAFAKRRLHRALSEYTKNKQGGN